MYNNADNTHGTKFRELLYRWHPWFGLRVSVHAAIDRPGGVVFRCSLSGSEADRWIEVPAWMFDWTACTKVRVAADARVDLAALTALAALLRHVLNDHLASSNAPLSAVLGVSREPNRGELHATPDQAAGGALPRAAADRPVRRRTAREDRKRARVAHTLPADIQAVLTELMTQLLLEHADQNRIGSMREAGHDI